MSGYHIPPDQISKYYLLTPITFVALSHQWSHLTYWVNVVVCRVCHQAINTINDFSLPVA